MGKRHFLNTIDLNDFDPWKIFVDFDLEPLFLRFFWSFNTSNENNLMHGIVGKCTKNQTQYDFDTKNNYSPPGSCTQEGEEKNLKVKVC